MAVYRVYGLVIESTVTMTELNDAIDGTPDYRFSLTKSAIATAGYAWFLRLFHEDGDICFVSGKREADFLLRYPGIADFEIRSETKEIVCHVEVGTGFDTVRHLLLDHVLPFLLSEGNRLVLHGSGILVAGGAVVFLGESGRGKSTLSASFCGQQTPLLTDDNILLEMRDGKFECVPSYPGLRLWPGAASTMLADSINTSSVAHYSTKLRIKTGDEQLPFASERVPLNRLYLLAESNDFDRTIQIKKLPPQKAFFTISDHAYRLDFKERTLLKDQFYFMSSLVKSFPVYSLTFPRDFSLLPAVRQTILDHLTEA